MVYQGMSAERREPEMHQRGVVLFSCISQFAQQPMIRHYPDDKNAGVQIFYPDCKFANEHRHCF